MHLVVERRANIKYQKGEIKIESNNLLLETTREPEAKAKEIINSLTFYSITLDIRKLKLYGYYRHSGHIFKLELCTFSPRADV